VLAILLLPSLLLLLVAGVPAIACISDVSGILAVAGVPFILMFSQLLASLLLWRP
jgi:hypothetical protein